MAITAQQNAFFEAYFALKPTPCIDDIVALRALTGIRANEISIWFRRRQIRERQRRMREEERTSESELEEPSLEQLRQQLEALWERIAESHRAIVNRLGIEEQ